MALPTAEPNLESLDTLGAESLCLFVSSDDRPLSGAAGVADWRLNGGLSRRLLEGFFTGAFKDQLLIPTMGLLPAKRVFAVGAGPVGELDAERLGALLELAASTLKKAQVQSVALSLPISSRLDDQARAEAVKRHFLPGFGAAGLTLLADRGLKTALAG